MMKSKEDYAIAVRKENGEIVVKRDKSQSIKEKVKILKLPILRGITNLIESLFFSFKTLTDSAEMAGIEFEDEPSKFEVWLEKKCGKSIMNVITAIASVLGVVLSLFLFMFLPSLATKGLNALFNAFSCEIPHWVLNIIEGLIKIVIFILYIYFTSLLDDIKRVYQYHGAEHKSIFCYESGEELTIENVRKHTRFHPRCGTSFIFVVLIISIAVMTVASTLFDSVWGINLTESTLLRTLIKILLLPLTVGISYEFISYAGKHTNTCTKILSSPGLWMQRLTTREPDDSMIEVAITSLKAALPEEFPDEQFKIYVPDEKINQQAAKETAQTDEKCDSEQNESKQKNINQQDENMGE